MRRGGRVTGSIGWETSSHFRSLGPMPRALGGVKGEFAALVALGDP